ncbi:ATP-binding protein [Pseudogemmobacter faecipullorum]|uniref:histidine kinase n=1 Tax=Pseudogemmobacter faecipullorum TaxID=2755041 RepID=A0ABS8CLV4_9RHOB|nr:ATP-binding protein [Pseudogemmobacter faecipullorum]MCB5410363.1 response regulator [Pseudogemmobacter faecipullorum]
MPHRRKSLARRIAFASVVISILSGMGLGGLLAFAEFRRSYDSALENNARVVAAALPQLESAYWDLDLAAVQATLDRLSEMPLVKSVRVRDLIFSPEQMQALKIGDLAAGGSGEAPGFWALSRIVPHDWLSGGHDFVLRGRGAAEPVAALELRLSFAGLYDELGHRALAMIGTTVLQSLLIAALLFWLVRNRVIAPLDALARAARGHRETGSFRFAGLRVAEVFDPEGDEVSVLAHDFNRTVTRMERYRDHLREEVEQRTAELLVARNEALAASRAKSVFLANMSHELRTPLNAITGLSDLLLAGDPDPAARGYVSDMRYAAQQLLGSIDQVLDFSKLEAGQMVYAARPYAPEAVFDEVLAEARALAHASPDLALRGEIAADVPASLRGDAQKVTQILLNLASNAVKFTPQGRVVLRITRRGDWLRLSVFDSGKGLQPGERDVVFRPFMQADSSAARDVSGTGLGLPIAAEMAVGMGGRLAFTSRSGRGSLFVLYLPLQGPGALPAPDPGLPRPELAPMPARQARLLQRRLARLCPAALPLPGLVLRAAATTGFELLFQGRLVQILPEALTHRELVAALRRAVAPEAWPQERAAARPGLAGKSILLIEDRAINRVVVEALLERAGAKVSPAAGGSEALALWQAQRGGFDLVLTDLHMPGMDGFTTIAALREAGLGRVPVVALSADVSTATLDACAGAGFAGFIGKPLSAERLLDELSRVLAGKRVSISGPAPDSPLRPAGRVFDQALLLRHAGGSASLAAAWLARLPAEIQDWRRLLAEIGAGGDGLVRQEVLHAIRGGAAQLGATTLAELCSTRELPAARLSAAIDALEASLPHPASRRENAAAPPASAAFAACLNALEGREMRGFDLLAELLPALPERSRQPLQEAAERLDFRAALQMLAALQPG